MSRTPTTLDADTAAFIQRRVSICAAGRNAANEPTAARAYGCRVSADRSTLTVYVLRSQATALIDAVEANGQVAVVFSRPTTNRTIQLKGSDARVRRGEAGDVQAIAEWVGSFVVEVAELGFNAPFVHAVCATQPGDVVAITFTPTDGFAQTPGPGAGARLEPARAASP
ncbi:MAG: hypothetical protein JSR73_08170 [Proteobacteria bacterium]|nr:hypothetical protein [Pseudomonadota bacterium]